MVSFQEQLRQRLAQITDNSMEQTTWEKLKAQRNANRQAAIEAIGQINAQTDAYRRQLQNYANVYNSGKIVKPTPTTSTTKPGGTKKKKKTNGSLGDALGDFAGGLGNIWG